MRFLSMPYVLAVLLLGAMQAMTPSMPSPTSQAFTDRAGTLTSRIANAQSAGKLAPGQEMLLRTQLELAQKAEDSHDSNAQSMLDVIDRQLAQVDHGLSRAEDGQSITVRVGEAVVVGMHDPYTYDLHLSDPSIISVRPGIMWTRGIQGIYVAKKPGMVTIVLEPRSGVQPSPPANLSAPVQFYVVVASK